MQSPYDISEYFNVIYCRIVPNCHISSPCLSDRIEGAQEPVSVYLAQECESVVLSLHRVTTHHFLKLLLDG